MTHRFGHYADELGGVLNIVRRGWTIIIMVKEKKQAKCVKTTRLIPFQTVVEFDGSFVIDLSSSLC